jgi:hypothetical protein
VQVLCDGLQAGPPATTAQRVLRPKPLCHVCCCACAEATPSVLHKGTSCRSQAPTHPFPSLDRCAPVLLSVLGAVPVTVLPAACTAGLHTPPAPAPEHSRVLPLTPFSLPPPAQKGQAPEYEPEAVEQLFDTNAAADKKGVKRALMTAQPQTQTPARPSSTAPAQQRDLPAAAAAPAAPVPDQQPTARLLMQSDGSDVSWCLRSPHAAAQHPGMYAQFAAPGLCWRRAPG